MTSAPDDPAEGARLSLERTTADTVFWFLGHRVTVGLTAVILSAGVVTASAVASGSAPPGSTPGNELPVSEVAPTAVPITAGEMAIVCAGDTLLTFDATGDGELNLAVDGPVAGRASGRDRAEVTVTGPAGTYVGRFAAGGRLDRMSWNAVGGTCVADH